MNGAIPDHFIQDLLLRAGTARHRYCLVISGDRAWTRKIALQVHEQMHERARIWLSDSPPANTSVVDVKKIQNILGDEVDLVFFDAWSGFNPDLFGAISGVIRGGGLLILLTPFLREWPQFFDPEYQRITVYPTPPEAMTGRFLERLVNIIQHDPGTVILEQGKVFPQIPAPEPGNREKFEDSIFKSRDQAKVVQAIIKVATGHRRRPLVITSDRGRGKTSALGIAAARLLQQGTKHIIVTAPRMDAIQLMFDHARHLLPQVNYSRGHLKAGNGDILFYSPDELLRKDVRANLLLVDEAAAIPTPLLEQLLIRYSRIVFATTIHGYEGTGRGFTLRFQKKMNERTPNWRLVEIRTPIRWAENDPLEDLVFRTLLFNAEIAENNLIINACPKKCVIEWINRDQLVSDEETLRQIFGLLINAHYQTRPADLRYLLDGPNLSVVVTRYQGKVVATALLAEEGGFDEDMAAEITAGKRRPHGHLIPETLASHVGLRQAPVLRGIRVVRIAVHPVVQDRGIGSYMLEQIHQSSKESKFDYLASCFGATRALLKFWNKNSYLPVRIGLQRNASSGEHSVVVLRSLSKEGKALFEDARKNLFRQLPYQLSEPLNDLEPDLVAFFMNTGREMTSTLDAKDLNDLNAFVRKERLYEACLAPVWEFVCACFMDRHSPDLNEQQRNVLIKKVLQKKGWQEIAKQLQLPGKKGVIEVLREALAQLIASKKNISPFEKE